MLISGYAPTTAPASLGAPDFDRIVSLVPGQHAVAYLNITGTLPLFATHFPRFPVLPGVLLIESGLALARLTAGVPELRLRSARRMRFRRFVVPGDQVQLTVTALLPTEVPRLSDVAHLDEVPRPDEVLRPSGAPLCTSEVPTPSAPATADHTLWRVDAHVDGELAAAIGELRLSGELSLST